MGKIQAIVKASAARSVKVSEKAKRNPNFEQIKTL
jgi:hypothetical protein